MAGIPLLLPTGRPKRSKVAKTNDDAQISKLSCVHHGYFRDNYVHYFVRQPTSRPPLINRGYYARYAAVRQLLHAFASQLEGRPFQIISIGAGFDTTFWQLQGMTHLNLRAFIELDVREVCLQKANIIRQHSALWVPLQGEDLQGRSSAHPELPTSQHEGGESPPLTGTPSSEEEPLILSAKTYKLLAADLRRPDEIDRALKAAGVDPELPAFVLSECVLVYMEREESAAALASLSDHVRTAAIVIYEQIKPHDAFGWQMLRNLQLRGCPLLGICSGLEEQRQRLLDTGWGRSEALDMSAVYRGLEPGDRQRIERLEIFDEFEEWDLIQAHYCIALGIKDAAGELAGLGLDKVFGAAE